METTIHPDNKAFNDLVCLGFSHLIPTRLGEIDISVPEFDSDKGNLEYAIDAMLAQLYDVQRGAPNSPLDREEGVVGEVATLIRRAFKVVILEHRSNNFLEWGLMFYNEKRAEKDCQRHTFDDLLESIRGLEKTIEERTSADQYNGDLLSKLHIAKQLVLDLKKRVGI